MILMCTDYQVNENQIEKIEEYSMATHFEKVTLFKKKFQSALNLGPNEPTLKKKNAAKYVTKYINFFSIEKVNAF